MYILNKTMLKSSSVCDKIEYLVIAEPVSDTSEKDHQRWVDEGISPFNDKVMSAWELYCSPLNEDDDSQLSNMDESRERNKFSHSPLYIAHIDDETEKAVGMIWIDDIINLGVEREGEAHIHLRVHNDYRGIGIGSELLGFFLKNIPLEYWGVKCAWPERAQQDDPTGLFKKSGFEIIEQYGLTFAKLELDN